MIYLEIVMIVIGLAAIIFSVKMAGDSEELQEVSKEGSSSAMKKVEEDYQRLQQETEKKNDEILLGTEDKLNHIANEKIMGLSEYSDQILDKMEKNHAEVVFLYNMLNEKQEEIRQLIQEADILRADLRDEMAKSYQQAQEEQEPVREEERNQTQAGSLEKLTEYWEPEVQESVDLEKASVYDEEIARIEREEKIDQLEQQFFRKEMTEQGGDIQETLNHNDEIMELHQKGHSVLEISKMLSLGQGEVKFVIDLHQAG